MLLHVFQKFLGFFFPDGPNKSFEEGYNWLLERRTQHAATHRLRSASAASSRFSRISFVFDILKRLSTTSY